MVLSVIFPDVPCNGRSMVLAPYVLASLAVLIEETSVLSDE